MARFSSCILQYGNRVGNTVAHLLARYAQYMQNAVFWDCELPESIGQTI